MKIWTVGHSNIKAEEFLDLLRKEDIERIIDVRTYPGSRYCPWYNQENMIDWLKESNVDYCHILNLGGRRTHVKDSDENAGWENVSFRSFADYMDNEKFAWGIETALEYSENQRCAIMCSEAVPWRCHRSLVSDALVALGHNVYHITNSKTIMHVLGDWGAIPEIIKDSSELGVNITYPK